MPRSDACPRRGFSAPSQGGRAQLGLGLVTVSHALDWTCLPAVGMVREIGTAISKMLNPVTLALGPFG